MLLMTLNAHAYRENQRLTEAMAIAQELITTMHIIGVYPGAVHIQTDGPIKGWEVRDFGGDNYTLETFTRMNGVLVFGIYNEEGNP